MTYWQRASQQHPGRHWLVSLTSPQEAAISGGNWWISNVATCSLCSSSLSMACGWTRGQAAENMIDQHLPPSIFLPQCIHLFTVDGILFFFLLCAPLKTDPRYLVVEGKIGHGQWLFWFLLDAIVYAAPGLQCTRDNSINPAKALHFKTGPFCLRDLHHKTLPQLKVLWHFFCF